MNSPELDNLIALLAKLPGLGARSARRAALYLLKHKRDVMEPLSVALATTADKIVTCGVCGNLDTVDPCTICTDEKRDPTMICVVEQVADLWAMERTKNFNGHYHVLGGTLSALDGIGPDDLNLASLVRRVRGESIREVILATNATVDGQTTAHYITDKLNPYGVNLSRLAHGVPLGGELDYLDDGTLTAAFAARRPF